MKQKQKRQWKGTKAMHCYVCQQRGDLKPSSVIVVHQPAFGLNMSCTGRSETNAVANRIFQCMTKCISYIDIEKYACKVNENIKKPVHVIFVTASPLCWAVVLVAVSKR